MAVRSARRWREGERDEGHQRRGGVRAILRRAGHEGALAEASTKQAGTTCPFQGRFTNAKMSSSRDLMSADPNKKSARTFQCRDILWDAFQQMAQELECSVDYLINESMKQYARQRYANRSRTTDGTPGSTSQAEPPPSAPRSPAAGGLPPPPLRTAGAPLPPPPPRSRARRFSHLPPPPRPGPLSPPRAARAPSGRPPPRPWCSPP